MKSINKKTTEWRELCVDAIISREGSGSANDFSIKEKMKICYDLYNSEFDINDLKYVTNPFQVEDSFPANPQNSVFVPPLFSLSDNAQVSFFSYSTFLEQ